MPARRGFLSLFAPSFLFRVLFSFSLRDVIVASVLLGCCGARVEPPVRAVLAEAPLGGCGCVFDPSFGQHSQALAIFSLPHPILKKEKSEPGPIPRNCVTEGRTHECPRGVGFHDSTAHANHREEFSSRKIPIKL